MIRIRSHDGSAQASRATLLLLPLLCLLAGCNWRGPQTLPVQIVGEWRTDEPRYHGRFLKLETDQITFGLGGLAPDKAEHIEKVRMSPIDNQTKYLIKLRAVDATPDSIVLQFTPENGGELRMKNQPAVVWKRENESSKTLPRGASAREILPPDRKLPEHKTIYKIDCIRPKVCRSF